MRIKNTVIVGVGVVALVLAGGGVASAGPFGSADLGSSGPLAGPLQQLDDLLGTGSSVGSSVLDGLGLGLGSSLPTQQCNESTKSGHDGITDTNHQLGRSGPLSFVLSYETVSVPDEIQVYYQGAMVATTGRVGDAINEGTGSIVVNLPPGASTSVMVRVIGGDYTDWEYTVNCPA
ncbi:MAG TPA: hypothetical protein VIW24_31440 [Aldersonia sp.]